MLESTHSAKTFRLRLLFLAALLCARFAPAAAEESPFGDSVDVRLVNVEAWVSDENGMSITGLTIDDFEILEDGAPAQARFFTEVRPAEATSAPTATAEPAAEAATEAAAEPDAAPDPGHLLIYADELHLSVLTRKKLIGDLRTFLQREGFPPERIMVVRQGQALKSEAFFGSTAEEIDAALDHLLDGEGPGELRADQELRLTINLIQQYWDESQSRSTGPGSGGPSAAVGGTGVSFSAASAALDACVWFTQRAMVEVENYAERSRDRTAATLGHLTEVATFLAGIDGVKTLLYLGDSLERMPGTSLMSYVEGLCRTGDPQSRVFPVTEEVAGAFQALTRHANTNRVTIYAFQSEGLSPSSEMSPSQKMVNSQNERLFDSARRQEARDGLGYLAEQTGGEAFLQKNSFDASLETVAQSMSHYYSIGYAPLHEGDGGEHKIEVRLREGVSGRLRHRQGYVDKDPMQRMTENLHTTLLLGIGENPHGIRLGVGETRAAGEGVSVPLRVIVPIGKLVFLPQKSGRLATLTVQVLARGANGEESPKLFTKSFRVPAPEDETAELFSLPIDLDLDGGVQTVAVSLRDGASRETSYVSTSLDLGDG